VEGRYRTSTSRVHGRKEGRREGRKEVISDRLCQCLSQMSKETRHRLDLFALMMEYNEKKQTWGEGRCSSTKRN